MESGVDAAPAAPTRLARRATSAMFLVCGLATSAWAPMVPFAKSRLALDEGALGLILLALGGGSMVAMPLAGVAIHTWSSRHVLVFGALLTCGTLPLLALSGTPLLLAGALFTFGAGLGAMDVAMNAHAIAVQRLASRPLMSGFHALFSVGGLIGAGMLSVLLRTGMTLGASAAVIAVTLSAIALGWQRHLLWERGGSDGTTFTIVPSRRVLLLGALCFISFLAEGAVLDWSAVFLRELRAVDVSLAGIGYAAFSVAMAAGRFTGDRLTHRAGMQTMLRIGGWLAAAGFVAVAAIPWTAGAFIGFVAIGLGASNIVPVLFSAAGHVRGVPAGVALATVTTIAYAGLLVGPALIGFVADATSLPTAFLLVAVMLVAVGLSAGSVGPPQRES